MQQGLKAFVDTSPIDQLSRLVLHLVSELSPCTTSTILDHITQSESHLRGCKADSLAAQWISKALLRLKELALIQLDHDEIVITVEGRRFVGRLSKTTSSRAHSETLKRSCHDIIFNVHAIAQRYRFLIIFLMIGLVVAWGVKSFLGDRIFDQSYMLLTSGIDADIGQSSSELIEAESANSRPHSLQAFVQPSILTEVNPVVAEVRRNLAEPTRYKGVASDDLEAMRSFYEELSGPPVWMEVGDFSNKAKAVISEIGRADEWGLPRDAFDLPVISAQATTQSLANEEIKLGLAILKYARFAKGGRLKPSRITPVFDQAPQLLSPKMILTAIGASEMPGGYLRSLHPNHEAFSHLREALRKARAEGKAGGKKSNEGEVQRLIVNMERWRWMPPELGAYHVWNNVPEFTTRVVKNGKTIYAEKTIVGQPKYATPIFSATMRSIVFHPEWVVPETVIREDLQPSLQRRRFFGGHDTSVLRQHKLKVSFKGRAVDADSVNWSAVNIHQYTFTQAPGSDNVLGRLKFNFPNKHAVYMHDTVEPELFAKRVRTFSHGCIRVHQPHRLAALLLKEDKGWPAQTVERLLARGNNKVVTLDRPIPVHMTYFTVAADRNGSVKSFADIYGLDTRMASVLFGKGSR
jgi:L,D-transpeptidase YcbB